MIKEIINKIKTEGFIQFIKFGMVGALNTVLSYLINNGCYYFLHLHEQICNIIAFIITVTISYFLNNKYVFNGGKYNIKSYLKVVVSYSFTGLFLSAVLLHVEERIFGIPNFIATFMNLVITIPVNFLLNKFWAFRKKDKKDEDKKN